MPDRVCVVCGNAFAPRGPQITCRSYCRTVRNAAIHRTWLAANVKPKTSRRRLKGLFSDSEISDRKRLLERQRYLSKRCFPNCDMCGLSFKPHGNQKRCSKFCRAEYNRQHSLATYYANPAAAIAKMIERDRQNPQRHVERVRGDARKKRAKIAMVLAAQLAMVEP